MYSGQQFIDATPAEFLQGPPGLNPDPGQVTSSPTNSSFDEKARAYVIAWRNQLRQQRIEKLNIWNECWALYRGQQDMSNKEDWQSQIVMPKAWGTVKQAVNVIKRFLNTAKKPWFVDTTSPADPLAVLRAEKITDIARVFLEKAHFVEEFSIGLETGFIMGLGVWKIGWNLTPRVRMQVQTVQVPVDVTKLGGMGTQPGMAGNQPPQAAQQAAPGQPGVQAEASQEALQAPIQRGLPQPIGQNPNELQNQQNTIYPTQLPNEAIEAPGAFGGGQSAPTVPITMPQKQVQRTEVMEGRLAIWAVDPYNFYWLPSSKLNRWTGTIEEIELPKWQLMEMAEKGAFDPAVVAQIGPMKIDEYQKQSWIRFGELPRNTFGPTKETSTVKLTEFYGPLIIDGEIIEPHAHVIIANDTWVLYNAKNDKWHLKPPYVAFSPLNLPFRTEGVGLVEMVRSINKALNQIVNLGVDTLLYRLMPIFEFTPDVYENPEDLRTGLTPGKVLRRNTLAGPSDLGLRPIQFEDVSPGASQMAGILDRAHQEGAMVTELQQSLPRWSGAQTATETEAIQENQSSFFGALATDIEQFCIAPIIEMSVDTIMQYLDTANDPRVASILGVGQQILAGMNQAEVMEMVQGDYEIVARGLSGQLEKAEMLQNLIQFMNIIGQNPESWLPYINQDAMLRRILESFRPTIHDIEDIICDPQTVAANKAAQQQKEQQGQMVGMIPELARLAHDASTKQQELQASNQQQAGQQQMDQAKMKLEAHNAQADRHQKAADQAIQLHQAHLAASKPAAKK